MTKQDGNRLITQEEALKAVQEAIKEHINNFYYYNNIRDLAIAGRYIFFDKPLNKDNYLLHENSKIESCLTENELVVRKYLQQRGL